jgi:hypothetical protein
MSLSWDQKNQKSEVTLGRLRRLLMMHPVSCPEFAALLGISSRTALNLLQSELVIVVSARRRKYALKRGLRGETSSIPVYCVSAEGKISSAGSLALSFDRGTFWDGRYLGSPVSEETRDGLWSGLPYPIMIFTRKGLLVEHLLVAIPEF